MYNAQTLLDEFRKKRTSGGLDRRSSPFASDVEILRTITDKLIFIDQRWKTQVRQENPDGQDLQAGVSLYDAPVSVLGRSIDAIGVIDTDGRIWWLSNRSKAFVSGLSEFAKSDTDLDSESGDRPKYWFFEPGQPRKIRIRPAPNWNRTDGLLVRFADRPMPLRYPVNRSTYTCEVEKGSRLVKILGTSGAVDIIASDEFGVIPTANSDGRTFTSTNNLSPLHWYRVVIADVDWVINTELFSNGTITGSAASWTLVRFTYGANKITYSGTDVQTGTAEQAITMATGHYYRFGVSHVKAGTAQGSIQLLLNGTVVKTWTVTAATAANTFDYLNSTYSGSITVQFKYTPVVGDASLAIELDSFTALGLGTLTLERDYRDPTQTGAGFIAAEVPGIEQYHPGSVRYAPAWLALADYLQRESPDMARIFKNDAMEILAEFVPDESSDDGWDRGLSAKVQNRGMGRGRFRNGVVPGSGSIIR